MLGLPGMLAVYVALAGAAWNAGGESCATTQPHRTSPALAAAGVSPSIVKQIIPLLEQLNPIYLDIANGAQEFSPAPEESRAIIRQGAKLCRRPVVVGARRAGGQERVYAAQSQPADLHSRCLCANCAPPRLL